MYKVLYFSGEHCQPCKAFAPIVTSVCKELEVDLEFISVTDHPDLALKYCVFTIPTTVIVVDNIPIKSIVGGRSRFELKKEINQNRR